MPKDRWSHPKNDGWTGVEYDFGVAPELNARVSDILNEACHVFRLHADGNWATQYKDRYALLLANEIAAHPSLIKRLLGTRDRVVKMVTYQAIELNKKKDGIEPKDA
jgi:hypothetical protein